MSKTSRSKSPVAKPLIVALIVVAALAGAYFGLQAISGSEQVSGVPPVPKDLTPVTEQEWSSAPGPLDLKTGKSTPYPGK